MFEATFRRASAVAHVDLRPRAIVLDARSRGLPLRVVWRPDLSRDAMLLIGLGLGLAIAAGTFITPVDALAYWEAGSSSDLYPTLWSETGSGYLFYPPPIAQVSTLLQPIGWPTYIVAMMVGTFAAFWYCARAWSLPLVAIGIPWFLGIGPEEPSKFLAYALIGNVQWILAALTVLTLRHPALWSIEFVTKVTIAVGWWWHCLRGEWRAAATGAAVTLLVVAVSVAVAPAMWIDYIGFAARNFTAADPPIPTFPIPLGIRLAMVIPLLVWGARTDRPWTVPLACGWALVAMFSFGFLPFWVAAWRVRSMTRSRLVSPPLRS